MSKKSFVAMKMHTLAANDMRELETKANERGIQKEDIVQVFQSKEGLFIMTYYSKD